MKKGVKLSDTASIKEHIIISTINKFSENIGGELFQVSKNLISKLKNNQFNSIIKKYIPYIQILSPIELKESVERDIKNYLEF